MDCAKKINDYKPKNLLFKKLLICKCIPINQIKEFLNDSAVNTLPAMQKPQETSVQSLGWEVPLEKGMATHSSILA